MSDDGGGDFIGYDDYMGGGGADMGVGGAEYGQQFPGGVDTSQIPAPWATSGPLQYGNGPAMTSPDWFNDPMRAAGGGGSRGGGGGGGLGSLVQAYQQSNYSNAGYGQASADIQNLYNQMIGVLNQTTGQREADIRADYATAQSKAMQNLARLGMANTTVAPTLGMGYQREMQSSLNRLADQLQQTRLGVMGQQQKNLEGLLQYAPHTQTSQSVQQTGPSTTYNIGGITSGDVLGGLRV